MKFISSLDQLTTPFERAVVTLGNFDGVHLGHREIFRRVVARARETSGTSVVFTFVPHPLKLIAPERAPKLINSVAEKQRLIEASRVDALICAPFDREFAAISADRFVEDILVAKVGLAHLVVGYDYAFGRNREGDADFLKAKGEKLGFQVEVLDPIAAGEVVYSSTRIRAMLTDGDVQGVVPFLGRHYSVEGEVIHGARRGKQLGFPTANLATEKNLLPKPGVYAVKVRHGETIHDGVVNVGCNPTFCSEGLSVEVHILDFAAEIYGETLRLYFIERLRDEMLFPSPAELIKAIGADVERARQLLPGARLIEYREYLQGNGEQEEGDSR